MVLLTQKSAGVRVHLWHGQLVQSHIRETRRGNRIQSLFRFDSCPYPLAQGLANMNRTLSRSNGDDMDISVHSYDIGNEPGAGAAVPHSGPSRSGASTTSSTLRLSSDVPQPPQGDKTRVSTATNHRPNKKGQKTSGRGPGRPTRAQPHEDDHSLFIAQANIIRGRASRTRSAARDLRPRTRTRTIGCTGTQDKHIGTSSKSRRSRMATVNKPSRSQMAARQQLNWQWAQSLIGLQLKVPGCKFLKKFLKTLSNVCLPPPLPRSSLTDHIKYHCRRLVGEHAWR